MNLTLSLYISEETAEKLEQLRKHKQNVGVESLAAAILENAVNHEYNLTLAREQSANYKHD